MNLASVFQEFDWLQLFSLVEFFFYFIRFDIYYIIMATSTSDRNKETNNFLIGGKMHRELVHTN